MKKKLNNKKNNGKIGLTIKQPNIDKSFKSAFRAIKERQKQV